jgi:hypothetical protein
MRVRGWAPCAILAVVAVLAGAFALSRSDSARGDAAGHARRGLDTTAATITVGPTLPVQPVHSGFLGLSFEWWTLENYGGKDPNEVDPVLENLIDNLTQGQPTILRIGGISTDRTWWPVAGVRRSPAGHYTLTTRRLQVAAALARATNAHLILGLNLQANSTIEVAAEAHAMMRVIGPRLIEGLELGNEPELYGTKWFYIKDHVEMFARPSNWDFQQFLPDWLRMARALGPVPLAGPAIGVYKWMKYLGQFLDAKRVAVVTLHRYPLQSCGPKPGDPNYPTIPHLLGKPASIGLADEFEPYVKLVHSYGELVRNAEMNSVSCGPAPGSANTFAGALWALNALFAQASIGVDGVNIHTYSNAPDQLWSVKHTRSQWQAYVAPEYYGVYMFSQAAPAGSRLLRVTVNGSSSTVQGWATRTASGQIHVVLMNDAIRQAQNVTVRLPGNMNAGTVEMLKAPRVSSTSGVTIGGQTFGPKTTTGLLPGPFHVTRLAPGTEYHVTLPAASAAMLTFG